MYGNHDETVGILYHVDVVPATGEWTSPPFEPTIRDISLLSELHKDYNGEKLNIQFQDEVTGPLTVNSGIISYEKNGEKALSLNIRVPVTTNYEDIKQRLASTVEEKGFIVSESRESQPHHVDANHPMIEGLQKSYQEETGLEPTLLSTGGATYARFMKMVLRLAHASQGKR